MKSSNVCGGTQDCAEIIVDYKTRKTEIKGVKEQNFIDVYKSVWFSWLSLLAIPFGILVVVMMVVGKYIPSYDAGWINWIGGTYLLLVSLLPLLHLNKRFDKEMRSFFAVRTGMGRRNRVKLSTFNSREFVLPNIHNIVLEYEAKGDVAKQLDKIWVRQEHKSSPIVRQARLLDLFLNDDKPIWNAYFKFNKIPKSGSLYLEWI